jgi:hypothetical protein
MKTTLRQQLEGFKEGKYLDSEGDDNDCYNFYDWFCKETSLKGKADKLFPQVKRFVERNPGIDLDKTYCFFKNSCPMNGRLYDQFKICDAESHDVIFCVTPKSGHFMDKGKSELYGKINDFKEPLATGKSFKDLLIDVYA